MKIYRYWVQEKVKIDIDGETKEIRVWGGVSTSMAEAHERALQNAALGSM